jgi:hypothetical protein
MQATTKRLLILGVLAVVVAALHYVASSRYGFFFPLPIMARQSTITALLAFNSLLQSLVLVFGISHLLGICRDATTFFHAPRVCSAVYLALLLCVVLAAAPGLIISRR